MKTGILLTNLGTPDSPNTPDVRKYLREFLMDKRVIDIPFIPRFLLVNGIIAPFRAPKSAKVYKKVWLEGGSPLKVYGFELANKVQQKLGNDYVVRLAMRYQNPSMESVFKELKGLDLDHIIVIPLFPQYASATSGSVLEEFMRLASLDQTMPEFKLTGPFFKKDFFLNPIADRISEEWKSGTYDQVLFSYHGLPERQIRKGDRHNSCLMENCCASYGPKNQLCYRAQCFETSRLLAKKAGLKESEYTTAFQSRLGKDPWIKPYTENIIKDWPKNGIKKVLALSPSFVADCLETTEEIGMEYKEVFEHAGGTTLTVLPCLNSDSEWAEGIANWVEKMVI
jgi:ferrochelatase